MGQRQHQVRERRFLIGLEVTVALQPTRFAARDEMTAAFKASGAKLACLCSSDEVYAREAAAAAQALRHAGASVWLAGRPAALERELTQAGVCGFIFVGCDALAALRRAYDLIAG